MELENMIDERLVNFGLYVSDKEDAIRKIAHMMLKADKISDEKEYIKGIFAREEEYATGIGKGIAIPHCKNKCVNNAAFTLVRLNQPIEWGSMDGHPINYVIMLAAPDGEDNAHIDMLAALARKLMNESFLHSLLEANTIDEIKKVFK